MFFLVSLFSKDLFDDVYICVLMYQVLYNADNVILLLVSPVFFLFFFALLHVPINQHIIHDFSLNKSPNYYLLWGQLRTNDPHIVDKILPLRYHAVSILNWQPEIGTCEETWTFQTTCVYEVTITTRFGAWWFSLFLVAVFRSKHCCVKHFHSNYSMAFLDQSKGPVCRGPSPFPACLLICP